MKNSDDNLTDYPEWWPEVAERDFARKIYEECKREDAAKRERGES